MFRYKAPVLVVTANKTGYGNAVADCAGAIENMMLEANELDLGTCWINQLRWLADNPSIRERMLGLGMKEDETVCASMALSHAATLDGLPCRAVREPCGDKGLECHL